jgi:hypothetical protein
MGLKNERESFAVTASIFPSRSSINGPHTRAELKEQPAYYKYLVGIFGFDQMASVQLNCLSRSTPTNNENLHFGSTRYSAAIANSLPQRSPKLIQALLPLSIQSYLFYELNLEKVELSCVGVWLVFGNEALVTI